MAALTAFVFSQNIVPEPSQWTVLALLAAVLGGVGVFLRDYFKKSSERQAEADGFIRQLAENALNNQGQHAEAWKEMTQQSLDVHRDVAEGIAKLIEILHAHEQATLKRHEKVAQSLDRIGEKITGMKI